MVRSLLIFTKQLENVGLEGKWILLFGIELDGDPLSIDQVFEEIVTNTFVRKMLFESLVHGVSRQGSRGKDGKVSLWEVLFQKVGNFYIRLEFLMKIIAGKSQDGKSFILQLGM
jgi:hypothetical protein